MLILVCKITQRILNVCGKTGTTDRSRRNQLGNHRTYGMLVSKPGENAEYAERGQNWQNGHTKQNYTTDKAELNRIQQHRFKLKLGRERLRCQPWGVTIPIETLQITMECAEIPHAEVLIYRKREDVYQPVSMYRLLSIFGASQILRTAAPTPPGWGRKCNWLKYCRDSTIATLTRRYTAVTSDAETNAETEMYIKRHRTKMYIVLSIFSRILGDVLFRCTQW